MVTVYVQVIIMHLVKVIVVLVVILEVALDVNQPMFVRSVKIPEHNLSMVFVFVLKDIT